MAVHIQLNTYGLCIYGENKKYHDLSKVNEIFNEIPVFFSVDEQIIYFSIQFVYNMFTVYMFCISAIKAYPPLQIHLIQFFVD